MERSLLRGGWLRRLALGVRITSCERTPLKLEGFEERGPVPNSDRFYITGGTLPQEALSYVTRQADKELVDGLLAGEFCAVLNARQMGKSSLMIRTLARLQEQGCRTVALDLTRIGGQSLTAEQWYTGLLAEVGRALGLRQEFLAYWREHAEFGLVQRFFGALTELALNHLDAPIVVFVDEVDLVRSLPFSTDEFFAAIRECYTRRAQDPRLNRLTFCLLGTASPADFIQDTRTTPFNIGTRIELNDFTAHEAAPLAQGFRANGERLLARVLHWTGGHPYLTQRLCDAVAGEGEQATVRSVDERCEELFLTQKARETDSNLTVVRQRLLKSEADLVRVLNLYGRVRAGKRVKDDPADPIISLLKLSGIVSVTRGFPHVRNRIYAQLFDRRWVRENLPDAEVRRQRAAYRRGVLRTAAIALTMLALVGGLAVTALRQARLARQSAEESRRQLARSHIANGMRLVEEGDAPGALPWLAEALRLDAGNPFQEKTDRLRLAMALQECPRPAQAWFHDGPVRSLELSPDDRLVVTASDDKTARVWEIATGKSVGAPMRHRGPVTAAAFSPDGRRVATASADKTARVWEARTGKPVTPPIQHRGEVTQCVFSPDGRGIATACGDQTVRVWDAATGKPVTGSLQSNDVINSVVFSPDGGRLLVASGRWNGGGDARIWDVRTGRLVGRPLDYRVIYSVFSPDGRWVATASAEHTARVWDAVTGKPVTPALTHAEGVSYCAFSPDGRRLATTSKDGTARVWDARTGQPVTPPLPHSAIVDYAAFSRDGNRVVTASLDGTARVWEVRTGKPVTPPLREAGSVRARLSRDDRWLVTAGSDGIARVWDLAVMPDPMRLSASGSQVERAVFSPDGSWVLSSAVGYTRVWDAKTGEPLTPGVPSAETVESAFSPDGHRVVTGTDRTAQVWEAGTGKVILRLEHPRAVTSATFSRDGRWLVTSCEDHRARLWDARTGKPGSPPWGSSGGVQSATFSPDGRLVATVAKGGKVGIWEVATGHQVLVLSHRDEVSRAAFSRDGTRLLTVRGQSGVESFAQVWDIASGRPMGQPVPCRKDVAAVFSPDGDRVAALDPYSSSARVWEATTGRPVTPPLRHANSIYTVAFSPDGHYVVTASMDHTARVWDAATGDPVSPPLQHGNWVNDAQFSPDGRRVVTASGDGYARVWNLPREDRPLPHLASLAQVLAGYRIDPAGGSVDLQRAEFRRDWGTLRSAYPGDLIASPNQVFAWELHQFEEYEQGRQWSPAAALLDRLKRAQPTKRELFGRLWNAYAELGEWDRAITDLKGAVALSKGEDAESWWHLPIAQLASGDQRAYRETCALMLDQRGQKREEFSNVAWVCTFGPDALPEMSRLVQLGERYGAFRSEDAYSRYVCARVLYRAHRYKEASQHVTEALQPHRIDPLVPVYRSQAAFWMAMCQARLGHSSNARAWLSLAESYDFSTDTGWNNAWMRAIHRFLRREAEQVVGRGR
jgi:WD40 repeat protein